MAKQARVKILHEVPKSRNEEDFTLCFQHVRYEYANDTEQEGYRFIWRRPNGNLQGARGQARIPSIAKLLSLVSLAMEDGWGNINGDLSGYDMDVENEISES